MFLTPVFWAIVLPALSTTFVLLRVYKHLQDQTAKEQPAKATIPVEREKYPSR